MPHLADGGAYCSVTPWVTWRSTVQCCGPYVVENVHCDTIGVYTNNIVAGAMRGFGSPQMNFVVEQMVEIAAERVGISGVEFRNRNMVRQGSVTITGQRLDTHKVAMGEVLDAVLKETDYEAKLAKCSHGTSQGDELYGIGLAMSYRGVSLGAEGVDQCAAIINVQPDGSDAPRGRRARERTGGGVRDDANRLARTRHWRRSHPLPKVIHLLGARQRHYRRLSRHDHGRRSRHHGRARA
jgi:CO/xanthine dehydrogenase Mo-binding subunit